MGRKQANSSSVILWAKLLGKPDPGIPVSTLLLAKYMLSWKRYSLMLVGLFQQYNASPTFGFGPFKMDDLHAVGVFTHAR